MIPEKAIDEAWDKLHENPTRPINISYSALEAALEAAAPYLTERAYNAGHLDGMTGAPNTNPYRSQA